MPTSSGNWEDVHNILLICTGCVCLQTIPPPLNYTYVRSAKIELCERFWKLEFSKYFQGNGLHVLAANISLGWSSAEILVIWDVLHILDFWDVLHISALFPQSRDLQGNRHLDYYVKETENSYTNHLVKIVLRSATFNPSFNTNVWCKVLTWSFRSPPTPLCKDAMFLELLKCCELVLSLHLDRLQTATEDKKLCLKMSFSMKMTAKLCILKKNATLSCNNDKLK